MELCINVKQQSLNTSKIKSCCVGCFLFSFGFIICFATMYSGLKLAHCGVSGESSCNRGVGHSVNDRRNDSTTISSSSRLAIAKPTRETKTRGYLVILIISAPDNKYRRIVIRQTWAVNLPNMVRVFFVVGTKDLRHRKKFKLFKEQDRYADLILLPNLVDDYRKLTIKVIESMKWVNEHAQFDYLLKTDDDSYVRVGEILESLKVKPAKMLYMGFFYERSDILDEGKWAEPMRYICDSYVDYAAGGGYVLSFDLVAYIVDNSEKLKKFTNEDVAVGTWLAPLEVNMVHDERFRMSDYCTGDFIIFHPASTEEIKKLNKNLATNNTLCSAIVY